LGATKKAATPMDNPVGNAAFDQQHMQSGDQRSLCYFFFS
jgi:hypothetical protein